MVRNFVGHWRDTQPQISAKNQNQPQQIKSSKALILLLSSFLMRCLLFENSDL